MSGTTPTLSQSHSASSPAQEVSQRQSIVLAHGGGGQLTDELISESILPRLQNDTLNELLDSALLDHAALAQHRLAMTVDSYVVQPLFFPGADIGRLAVSGTVNDLSVCGATPLGLALSLILTEGLPKETLERVMDSIAVTAREANVRIVTGDTKVIERHGSEPGLFITTAGVGLVPRHLQLSPQRVQVGDVIIVTGPIGDHGLTVMLARQMPDVQSPLRSDAAPLNGLIQSLLQQNLDVKFIRDATRGGLSCVTVDLAQRTGLRVEMDEDSIPIRPEAAHAADMLGLDPLEIANEGKVVIVVAEKDAKAALQTLQKHSLGRESALIGQIMPTADGQCVLRTRIGGKRIVQKPYGEQLPRIC